MFARATVSCMFVLRPWPVRGRPPSAADTGHNTRRRYEPRMRRVHRTVKFDFILHCYRFTSHMRRGERIWSAYILPRVRPRSQGCGWTMCENKPGYNPTRRAARPWARLLGSPDGTGSAGGHGGRHIRIAQSIPWQSPHGRRSESPTLGLLSREYHLASPRDGAFLGARKSARDTVLLFGSVVHSAQALKRRREVGLRS